MQAKSGIRIGEEITALYNFDLYKNQPIESDVDKFMTEVTSTAETEKKTNNYNENTASF